MENDNKILDSSNNELTNENIINVDYNNLVDFVETRNKKYHQILFNNLLEYILVLAIIFSVNVVNSKEKSNIAKSGRCDNKVTEAIFNSISETLKERYGKSNILKGFNLSSDEEIEEYAEVPLIIDLYCERIYNFLIKEKITLDQFSEMLTMMTTDYLSLGFNYETELDAFLDICFRDERSYPEKMLITMIRDGLSYDELDIVCAGCVKESKGDGACYDECYAVASTLINRSHTKWYVDNFGTSIYALFTAPSQYSVWPTKDYLDYIGCIDLEGYQAAVDAFYTREPSHDYLQFRGRNKKVNANYEILTQNGNKFFDKIKENEYVPYEDFKIEKEASMRLVLENKVNDLNNK